MTGKIEKWKIEKWKIEKWKIEKKVKTFSRI